MHDYFKVDEVKDVLVVTFLFSDLSMTEAEEFKSLFYGLVSETQNKFVIDMHKCAFIPSVVLGIITNFNAKARSNNGRAVFCALTDQGKTIFQITKLDVILETYKTQREAVASFK